MNQNPACHKCWGNKAVGILSLKMASEASFKHQTYASFHILVVICFVNVVVHFVFGWLVCLFVCLGREDSWNERLYYFNIVLDCFYMLFFTVGIATAWFS